MPGSKVFFFTRESGEAAAADISKAYRLK